MDTPPELSTKDFEAIDACLAEGPEDWLSLGRALDARSSALESPALQIVAAAFLYDLALGDGPRRAEHGPFVPMHSSPEGTFPIPPKEAGPEVLDVWRTTFEEREDPILRSRIGDLLFVAQGSAAHELARSAAGALVEVATSSGWPPIYRAKAITRATEILATLNDSAGLATAVPLAAELAEEFLEGEHPGPPFIVIRSLIDLKAASRPAELDRLIDRAVTSFSEDHAREGAYELAASATDDGERRETMRRAQLQVRIDAAAKAEGFEKVVLLQRAIELASRYQFHAEAKGLVAEQEAVREENLDFESTEVEVSVPTAEIREQVERTVGMASDVFDALTRIGRFGPPGNSNEEIDQELAEINKEHPLLGLFGRQVFNQGSSVPSFIADDEHSKQRAERGQHRQQVAYFYGSLLIAPMLDECPAKHGRPAREDLDRHFSTELIGEVRGERIGRAVELFWDGDYDDAAHVLVPRLESFLRDIARHEGLVVSKQAKPGAFGGVTSLNVLMRQLREVFAGSAWFDYLEALLCEPLSLNLRNEIAHGLIPVVERTQAALLVHAACFLASGISIKETPE